MSLDVVQESPLVRPRRRVARRWRACIARVRIFFWPLVVFLCGIGVAYQGAIFEHAAQDERRRDIVRSDLEPIRETLSRELFAAIELTEGIAGLITIDGGATNERLRAFSAELLRRSDLIRNVAVAPNNTVSFVFPRQGNERAIGLDYAKTADQWPSVARMMKERRIVIAGPVALVQGGVGIIGRRPVYLSDSRRGADSSNYWGLISTVIDFERLLAKTAMAATGDRLAIGLRGVDGLGERGAVFWGEPSVFKASPVIVDVPLPSGSWQLAAIPREGWPPPRVLASTYFLAGAVLSAVLAAFLFGILKTSAARQQVAEALAERERQLKEAMRVGRVGLWRWECETDAVTLFDDARLYGLQESGPFPLRDLLARLPSSDAEAVENALRKARRERGRLNIDYRVPWPSGEMAWFSAQGEIATDGEDVLLGTFIDITERTRAWEQIQKLNEDLQRHAEELERRVAERTAELALAKERAESADRLKSAFLATMSHELRTPLNSIIGFTGIVLQEMPGPLNDEQKKQLGMVRSSAQHLLALINDVLDISKIEAGELTIDHQPFDLAASIQKVQGIVQPLADRKGLALTVRIAEGVGVMKGDVRRVEQILLNLLSNAIKFTEKGSVSLVAELTDGYTYKERQESLSGRAARLHVADTGIGIKPEHLARLFQPFRQIDSELTRAYEGTGLGLAISQRLAALMGGSIEVTSRWQQGSEFVVTLPVR